MIFDQRKLNFRKTKLIRQYLSMGIRLLFSGRQSTPFRKGTITVVNDKHELIRLQEKTSASCDVVDLTGTDDLEAVLKSRDFVKLKTRTHRLILPIGNGNLQSGLNLILSNNLSGSSKQSLSFEMGSCIAMNNGEPGFVQSLSGSVKMLRDHFPDAEFLVRLDSRNCYWADDCLRVFEELGIKRFFFTLSEAFIKNPGHGMGMQKAAFHTLMFLESLQRHPSIGYAERKVYMRLTELVQIKFLSIIRSADGVNRDLKEDACLFLAPDLLVRITLRGIIHEAKKLLAGKLSLAKTGTEISGKPERPTQPQNPNPKNWKRVLITGWYGTETQGDKAILGELLHFIKQCSPGCEILLTTIHPIISEQTNTELEDLRNAKLVDIKEASASPVIRMVDAVIMGGGPLTDSSSMREVWKIFSEANRQEKSRVIFGCGIGPLHSPEYIDWTRKILELTTAGFLRDKESKEKADELCPANPLNVACDPAIAFVSRWRAKSQVDKSKVHDRTKVGTLLRAMTLEFNKSMSPGKIAAYNAGVGKEIAGCLSAISGRMQMDLLLLHMNAPWIGGDDRLFNRYIEASLQEDFQAENIREYLTLDEHLEKMCSLRFALAMRYHGHIFSLALGIPFLSIDYTGKQGKVANLLKRIGCGDITFKLEDINQKDFIQKWEALLEREEEIKRTLLNSKRILVTELYDVYRRTFDVDLHPDEEFHDR